MSSNLDPVEAEISVLGSVLLKPSILSELRTILASDEFCRPEHSAVFLAACALSDRGECVDASTVYTEIARTGKGVSAETLGDLVRQVPSYANWKTYAIQVRECADVRAIKKLAKRVEHDADNGKRASELREEIQSGVQDIVYSAPAPMASASVVIKEAMSQNIPRYSFNIPVIDKITDGVFVGSSIVIGGRSGSGKTALMLQMCAEFARQGLPVAFISGEMSKFLLGLRLLAQESRVPADRITRSQFNAEEAAQITGAVERIGAMKFELVDKIPLRLSALLGVAEARYKAGAKVVAFDYLQKVNGPQDKRIVIDTLSAEFARMAHDYDGFAILGSQIRKPQQGSSARPDASDLKETGGIEHDADQIYMLFRAKDDDPLTHKGDVHEVTIVQEKNRNGLDKRAIVAAFHGPTTRFELMEENDGSMAGGMGRSDYASQL